MFKVVNVDYELKEQWDGEGVTHFPADYFLVLEDTNGDEFNVPIPEETYSFLNDYILAKKNVA